MQKVTVDCLFKLRRFGLITPNYTDLYLVVSKNLIIDIDLMDFYWSKVKGRKCLHLMHHINRVRREFSGFDSLVMVELKFRERVGWDLEKVYIKRPFDTVLMYYEVTDMLTEFMMSSYIYRFLDRENVVEFDVYSESPSLEIYMNPVTREQFKLVRKAINLTKFRGNTTLFNQLDYLEENSEYLDYLDFEFYQLKDTVYNYIEFIDSKGKYGLIKGERVFPKFQKRLEKVKGKRGNRS